MALNANISLGAMLSTASSALQANQTALRVTANNIANVNTEGYHRRQVEFGPRLTSDRLTGVAVEEVRRIADEFLARETIDANGELGKSTVMSSFYSRVQQLIGTLNDGNSLNARLSGAMTSLQQLSVDPASAARRNSALAAVGAALSSLSGTARSVQALRQDANTQITTDVKTANQLMARIYDLNEKIKNAVSQNVVEAGLADQRDIAIGDLSKYMDIRTFEQSDGRVFVSLSDGTNLINDLGAELQYSGPTAVTASTVFPPISIQRINPEDGSPSGPAIAAESRIVGGELRGLLDMRDRRLPDLAEQLGQVAGGLADQLNAIHNDNVSVPPPSTLTGVNTGLLASDPLNFNGVFRAAVVDAQGALVQQVAIDTTTLSTVGDLVSAINSGLSGRASASFSNGVLSIGAVTAGQGIALVQDADNPALRGGHGLSHFFGLNNLVTAASPSHFATGVQSTDAHQFTPGGLAEFTLRGTNGATLSTFSVTISGSSVADILSLMNTAAGGLASFALDANGRMTMTPSASAAGARLEVRSDNSSRGATGVSMTQFFGLGTTMVQNQASSMAIRKDIQQNNSRLALAQLDLSPSSVAGNIVLGAGDNRGAIALANAANVVRDFPAVGGLASGRLTLNDYVALVSGSQTDLAVAAEDERLSRANVFEEVKSRRDSKEGVNLDEELANMMVYQQAYNASARLMTVAQEMYKTLLEAL